MADVMELLGDDAFDDPKEEEDEEEEDELENIPAEMKTKSGYLKDGFVVDDNVIDGKTTSDGSVEEDEWDDTSSELELEFEEYSYSDEN